MSGNIFAQTMPATTTPLNSATNNRGNTSEANPAALNNARTTENPQSFQGGVTPVVTPTTVNPVVTPNSNVINNNTTGTTNAMSTTVNPVPVNNNSPVVTTPGTGVNTEVPAVTGNSIAPAGMTGNTNIPGSGMQGNAMNPSKTAVPGLTNFAAIPVLSTYVPGDIVSMIKNKYAGRLYDITRIKAAGTDQYKYIVRFRDNGVYNTETINEQGVVMK